MGVVLYIGLNCMMVTFFSDPRTIQGGYIVLFIACQNNYRKYIILCACAVLLAMNRAGLHIYLNVAEYHDYIHQTALHTLTATHAL